MSAADHWEKVYAAKAVERLGWFSAHLETSLRWIDDLGLDAADAIIDVGGGASTLVDDLLARGHRDLTVLDLSSSALAQTKRRLGDKSAEVTWLQGDVSEIDLPAARYCLWHDRAAFHFLTGAKARTRYRQRLLSALRPGGFVVMGCFAPAAPAQCSGLPVRRYTRELLGQTLGKEFEMKRHHNEIHVTPGGLEQAYLYCLLQKVA